MASKYNVALKFYTETKNKTELDKAYTEIEAFLTKFTEFKFFHDLTLKQAKTLAESGFPECPMHSEIFHSFRFRKCEEVFGTGDFNFTLYKYALDTVFAKEQPVQPAVKAEHSWSPTAIAFSIAALLVLAYFSPFLSLIS